MKDDRGGRRDVTTVVAGVTAQTLRHLELMLTAPWQVTLTRDAGFPVPRPRTIAIPNPAACIVQKMLVIPKRRPTKQAKDLSTCMTPSPSLQTPSPR